MIRLDISATVAKQLEARAEQLGLSTGAFASIVLSQVVHHRRSAPKDGTTKALSMDEFGSLDNQIDANPHQIQEDPR